MFIVIIHRLVDLQIVEKKGGGNELWKNNEEVHEGAEGFEEREEKVEKMRKNKEAKEEV